MILKCYDRARGGRINGGWTYVDGIDRIETVGPIRNDDLTIRAFKSHDELMEWGTEVWGSWFRERHHDSWAFFITPTFRDGDAGLGGSSDEYQVTQVECWMNDGRVGLAFVTQDEAYLMSDDGKTLDRL